MKFVIEINANNKFELIRSVENELIMTKGRIEMDRNSNGVEPSEYTLRNLERLESLLKEIKGSKEMVLLENGERLAL
jgi:hypothetical protein